MRLYATLGLTVLLLPLFISAQGVSKTTETPGQTAGNSAADAPAKTAKFTNSRLGFSFEYPDDLVPKKLPDAAEQHSATAKRQPADETPEYKKVDNCTQVVLQAKRKDDPERTTGTIAFYGNGKKPDFAINPSIQASVTIAEMDIACFPKEYVDHEEEVASGIAQAAIQGQELKQIDDTLWYDVDGHKVHMAAAMGPTIITDKNGKETQVPPTRYVAGLSTVVHGTVVLWIVEANEVAYFNRILNGTVQFGEDKPLPLFPAAVGEGERIKPVP